MKADLPRFLAIMALALSPLLTSTAAFAIDSDPLLAYKKLERGAMAGDYQDQRNLAFALTGGYGSEIPKNPILACAWRLVILASGDRRVDEGDVGNKQLYCDKRLDADSQAAAKAQAEKLTRQIKDRR
mgnify:CR=1 FL=1